MGPGIIESQWSRTQNDRDLDVLGHRCCSVWHPEVLEVIRMFFAEECPRVPQMPP